MPALLFWWFISFRTGTPPKNSEKKRHEEAPADTGEHRETLGNRIKGACPLVLDPQEHILHVKNIVLTRPDPKGSADINHQAQGLHALRLKASADFRDP